MPVWHVAAISDRPSVTLTEWSVFEATVPHYGGRRTRHLAGWALEDRQGQVCSEIRCFDPAKRSFVTESGRIYTLKGPSGSHPDVEYVLARWMRMHQGTEYLDVTRDVEAQLVLPAARKRE